MRLNPRAVLSLLADDDLVIELCEASLCVLHCEVKVMSKVNLGWRRLPRAAEGFVGGQRLSKGLQGCQRLTKAVEVVEGCRRLSESAKVEGVSELKSAC